MIRRSVRGMLGREDAELALRLVSEGSREEYEAAERDLRDRGISALLDHPKLFPALLQNELGARASLPLLSSAAARASLRKLGEGDESLADYLAAVIATFGIRDRATRITDADDQSYACAADIAADLDDRDPRRSFLSGAHLGNYSLWLSGLFPDFIEYRSRRRGGPALDYYEEMGKRGYSLAAAHRLASEYNLAATFKLLAERFLVLRLALNSISDTLLFPANNSPDRLMRQVRDEFRWRRTG